MVEKIILTDSEKNKIFEMYDNGISAHKIKNEFPYSLMFIQKQINSRNYEKSLNLNYPNLDGYHIVAICKKTNKVFEDYKNTSGVITSHLLQEYNIELPSNFKRKSIEYKTGKFWFHDYFEFDYVENLNCEKFECKLCNWKTIDINNVSGSYERHLKSEHNISVSEYLNKFPNDIYYFKNVK